MEDGAGQTRSVLECGGKRSATPLWPGTAVVEKLRNRFALPEQSKTWRLWLLYFCFLLSAFSFRASGQSYSIDWYKVAGGGGTSTGGIYQVSGTIGQHDAGGPMIGGNYSLTGGFWALISVAQTPGLPNLTVSHSGNSVIVSWPDPATNSYTLQQNSNLANSSGWVTSVYAIFSANGTNSITITPPTGNLLFRLKE
jgi:hypothetical protein